MVVEGDIRRIQMCLDRLESFDLPEKEKAPDGSKSVPLYKFFLEEHIWNQGVLRLPCVKDLSICVGRWVDDPNAGMVFKTIDIIPPLEYSAGYHFCLTLDDAIRLSELLGGKKESLIYRKCYVKNIVATGYQKGIRVVLATRVYVTQDDLSPLSIAGTPTPAVA
jgi:hypothetical protein